MAKLDGYRNLLNRCWFDEIKCAKGITALESYKKQWNDRHGCWSSQPLHNFARHGADAFRMLAVGNRQARKQRFICRRVEKFKSRICRLTD